MTSFTQGRRFRLLLNIARIGLGAGLLVYIISITDSWTGAREILDRPLIIIGFMLLPFFGAAVEAVRLGLLFRSQSLHLSFLNGYRVVSIGALFSFAIPGGTGGDVAKLYYLATENRGRTVEIATILLVDRIVALFALLILIIFLAALNFHVVREFHPIQLMVVASAIIGVLILLFMLVAFSVAYRGWPLYRKIIDKAPGGHFIDRICMALHAFKNHRRSLLYAAVISMVGHIALLAMFALAGTVLIPGISALTTVLLSMLGMLANALPITPGGVGVGEAAFDWLFGLLGYKGGAQLILAWRISILPICFLGAVFYMTGKRQPVSKTISP